MRLAHSVAAGVALYVGSVVLLCRVLRVVLRPIPRPSRRRAAARRGVRWGLSPVDAGSRVEH